MARGQGGGAVGLGHQRQGGVGPVRVGMEEAVRGEGGGQALGGSDDGVSTASAAGLSFQTLAASRCWRGGREKRTVRSGQWVKQPINDYPLNYSVSH